MRIGTCNVRSVYRAHSLTVVAIRKQHYEDLNVRGRIILKWTLEKWDGVIWTELI
jgi:hypothetical protein